MRYGKFNNKIYKGYDSKLEKTFHASSLGQGLQRERLALSYTDKRKYQPDFHQELPGGGVAIFECKGMYTAKDSRKILLALEQNREALGIKKFNLVLARYNDEWLKFLERAEKKLPGIDFGVIYVR